MAVFFSIVSLWDTGKTRGHRVRQTSVNGGVGHEFSRKAEETLRRRRKSRWQPFSVALASRVDLLERGFPIRSDGLLPSLNNLGRQSRRTNVGQRCLKVLCFRGHVRPHTANRARQDLGWMTVGWSASVQPDFGAERPWSFSRDEHSPRNTAFRQWRENVDRRERQFKRSGGIDKRIRRWLYRKLIFEVCLSNVYNTLVCLSHLFYFKTRVTFRTT